MGKTSLFYSPGFLKIGSMCMEAGLHSSSEPRMYSFAGYFLLYYRRIPTTEAVCVARLARQPRSAELLSSWKWHCVPLPSGQVKSSTTFISASRQFCLQGRLLSLQRVFFHVSPTAQHPKPSKTYSLEWHSSGCSNKPSPYCASR